MPKTAYQVLGVPPQATTAEVKTAYRRLAKLHHPDQGGAGANEHFLEIHAAYQILLDPERREAHDRAPDQELEAEILKERRLQLRRRRKRLMGLY